MEITIFKCSFEEIYCLILSEIMFYGSVSRFKTIINGISNDIPSQMKIMNFLQMTKFNKSCVGFKIIIPTRFTSQCLISGAVKKHCGDMK